MSGNMYGIEGKRKVKHLTTNERVKKETNLYQYGSTVIYTKIY